MMSSNAAEVGFVVELPSEINQFRLIIVAAGDTVQCLPTREQRHARLGDSVLFEESPHHRTDPRTVIVQTIRVSTDVARFTPDPEDEGAIIITTKVKSILPWRKHDGKRQLKTKFFNSIPETEEMRDIPNNCLIGMELKVRKINFSRYEIISFNKMESCENLHGLVFKRNGSMLHLYVPGFSDAFQMDATRQPIEDDIVGKWVSFWAMSDVRTVDVSKDIRLLYEDPFVTRYSGYNTQIMRKCFIRNSEVFSKDFEEQIFDRYNVLPTYDLRQFDGRLWTQTINNESTNTFELVIAKVQEQLGSPKTIPPHPMRMNPPVSQPAHLLRPHEKPSKMNLHRDSNRSRETQSYRSQPVHNPRHEGSYTFTKAGRKHNPDGSVALLHDERAANREGTFDRPSRSSSSKSSSSSDGPSGYYLEERKEMKKVVEQLAKSQMEISKLSKTVTNVTKDNTLLSTRLDNTRREKLRGDFVMELLRNGFHNLNLRKYIAACDPRLAEDLEEALFCKNFTPR